MIDHKTAFRNFLGRAEDDGWIASYQWSSKDSFVLLREEMNAVDYELGSRTHKKSTDGIWWGLNVEAQFGTSIGVDLELLIERPILNNPEWISNRLGISRSSSSKEVLEEWACREAAFKCLAPNNKGLYLSQFRKVAPGKYTIFMNGQDLNIQTKMHWWEKWLLALAWRISS